MLIGTGQLAKMFNEYKYDEQVCIFASGVSNSNCVDKNEFKREEKLLTETLKLNSQMKFVYFSSCALSSDSYPKNAYYLHKIEMENLIKKSASKYYIFRLPQLFGNLFSHKTLINFLYNSIREGNSFFIYDEAYRYVIDIDDVKEIVNMYLIHGDTNTILDLANDYRYKVLDIVYTFEKLLNKKAYYSIIEKEDKYNLDLTKTREFLDKHFLEFSFGKEYLISKLKKRIK